MSDMDSEPPISGPKLDSDMLHNSGTDHDHEKPEGDIEQVLAQEARENAPIQAPPPNGGTVAWLQVLGTFFLWFASLYPTLPALEATD
jgi:hypothetical protein